MKSQRSGQVPFTNGGSSPQGLCGLCQYESDMSAGDARHHQRVLAMDLAQSMEAARSA